jgi:predicted Zn-dependent peptidase
MESTDSRMHRLARNEIYFGRDIPIEEVAKGIEQVSNDQIIELASSFFKADSMGFVVLGDLKGRTLGTESLSPLA